MTDLLQRFNQDLELRGFAERSIQAYVRAVKLLSEHYHKSPDQINEDELRRYFLYNKNIRKWSRTASTIAICGIKHFFTFTLKRDWTTIKFVRPPKEKKLPPVLSREEVKRIFNNVKSNYHYACLFTMYSLGLRLRETTHLKVSDIDSQRMFVHIQNGKGSKDRYIPLPQKTLDILRQHWKTHRNPLLLFPAPGRGYNKLSTTKRPLPDNSIQIPFKQACKRAKILKFVSVRHLRHAYAVHLLEAGVNLRFVQEYLGHSDPRTTMIYCRMINLKLPEPTAIINKLMDQL
ncbi:MAG TPA: integrase [Candidatus Atribacteria bacterium]|nr:integrase [Candidatus Atribacteria bacterium]